MRTRQLLTVAIVMIVPILVMLAWLMLVPSSSTTVALCSATDGSFAYQVETTDGKFELHHETVEEMIQSGVMTGDVNLPVMAAVDIYRGLPLVKGPSIARVNHLGDTVLPGADAWQMCRDAGKMNNASDNVIHDPY